jgi:hypothetical protein
MKLSIKVEAFKALRSNTLYGFVDLVVPEMHLRVKEATVHESRGRRWIGLPAKPQITRGGQVRRGEHQKTLYVPVLEFTDRATRDAFSQRAIAALLESFPHAFDSEVPA